MRNSTEILDRFDSQGGKSTVLSSCVFDMPEALYNEYQLGAVDNAPAAHKGMIYAAKVMAATAKRAIEDQALREAARAEHQAQLKKTPYVSPLPEDISPPVVRQ